MIIYHNKDNTLGFTKKFRRYERNHDFSDCNKRRLKGSIGLDSNLLKKALRKLNGNIELEIRQTKGYAKGLFIKDLETGVMIAEFILPISWKEDTKYIFNKKENSK